MDFHLKPLARIILMAGLCQDSASLFFELTTKLNANN
jgi:hypothetical protein